MSYDEVKTYVIIAGLGLNFASTVLSFIKLRLEFENRITKVETKLDCFSANR